MKRTLSIVLAVLMLATACLGMVGCGNNEEGTPLVVGYAYFNSKFSSFFAETAYDQDVAAMTQIGLLSSDRMGAIIYKGIRGETIKFNGTDYTYYGPADLTVTGPDATTGEVYYDFTLRNDIKFSDGKALTVDDVIFNMYVLSDPVYDGSSTFFALPIKGMQEYRSGMDTRGNLIFKAGDAGYTATEYYTEEQYNKFWDYYKNNAGADFAQEIVDYCIANGYNAATDTVAQCAVNWGYELAENATAKDFWNAIVAAYDTVDEAVKVESAGHDLAYFAIQSDVAFQQGVQYGDSAANIAGIEKTGDNSLRVTLTEVDAQAIYQLGVNITPMHYYGEESKYDYAKNRFGFDKGDLSHVKSKTTTPVGAGPYKFVKYENGVVSFTANDSYYLGAPKTKNIQFKEGTDEDKLNGILTGTIDIADPSFNKETVNAIKKTNANGELNGDKVVINAVNNLGYGYIGMNAERVCIGAKDSAASKNLRKALATVLAVFRDVSVSSYYGERASVINYPISDTSWAAPQVTDDGYKIAFSTDVEGRAIYTDGMSQAEKVAAAEQAALGYLAAAGYTVNNGKVTAAPEGGKLDFEVLIPADGKGDHPTFYCLSEAAKSFANIGINFKVTDLAQSSELWTKLEAGQVDMWAAAWGATVDPDMYQIYFSGDAQKEAGGSNYMYKIADAQLNKLILDARKSLDQNVRKTMYKQCLDIIIDWAVEIPVYQRQNVIVFSPERVNMDTVTKDITTFYGWMGDIQNLEMK